MTLEIGITYKQGKQILAQPSSLLPTFFYR